MNGIDTRIRRRTCIGKRRYAQVERGHIPYENGGPGDINLGLTAYTLICKTHMSFQSWFCLLK